MRELEAQLRAYGLLLDRGDMATTDVVVLPHRLRRSFVVAVAAAIVVVLAASAIVAGVTRSGDRRSPRVETPAPTTVPAVGAAGVVAIGDSVMLGARDALESAIPGITVDAVLSRQFLDTVAAISQHDHSTVPFGTLVVALGTNGPATAARFDAIMRAAGRRQVFFVTVRVPRAWEAEVNDTLQAGVARWPNARVIDWHEFAKAHDDWFVTDGFHLNSAGQHAYALLIAESIGRPPATTTTTVSTTSALDVVNVIDAPRLPPAPLATAAGLVWIATESVTGNALVVHLEGRNPSSTKVVDTIDVPQEAVFSIAGDGDTLWVAGGGDGGVSQTTVSKVDVRTKSVVFTKTLTGTPCSCPIFAGSAGVWLTGNSSDFALRLSETDGHVVANVRLGGRVLSQSAIEVGSRLVVGLDDGSLAVVDPATNRVERSVPAPVVGDPPTEAVVAMTPAAIAAVGSTPRIDAFVARSNGTVSALDASDRHVGDATSVDFPILGLVSVGNRVWTFGSDRLAFSSVPATNANEFVYDPVHRRIERVSAGATIPSPGFGPAVGVGNNLWIVYDSQGGTGGPSIVVLKTP